MKKVIQTLMYKEREREGIFQIEENFDRRKRVDHWRESIVQGRSFKFFFFHHSILCTIECQHSLVDLFI